MPDMTHEERKEFDRKLAILSALAAVGKAQFEANPAPHIGRCYHKMFALTRAIEEATWHLSGMSSYNIACDIAPETPVRFVETTNTRNRKALEILTAAVRKFHGYES